MPRKETDFSKLVMYKFVCKDLRVTNLYVGHTTNFVKRKCCHKSVCNNEKSIQYNFKLYETIRNNGGWDNWSMIEIEKYPCNDKREAEARERYWIETLNSDLNTYVPNRNQQERENLEERQLYLKNYRETHKDHIKEYHKSYQKEYYLKNKERKQAYYLEKKNKNV